jgi:opacity protein-like surface antigen
LTIEGISGINRAVRYRIHLVALLILTCVAFPPMGVAQEAPQGPVQESTKLPQPEDKLSETSSSIWDHIFVLDKRKAEVYMAMHGFRSSVSGLQVRDTNGQSFQFPVEDGWGGGAKVGAYIPPIWKISFGAELETYLFRNPVTAPDAANGLSSVPIRQYLEVWNIMVNLLARYPGETYQPYIGAGLGASGVEIRGGHETLFSQTDAYQLFAGIRTLITDHWFAFGEYKMVYANYQYDCNPKPCLT